MEPMALIWRARERVFDLKQRVLVMGIVNVTPDSFSEHDNPRFDPDVAIAHALTLAEEGADVVDIGGESTRPGADPVTPEEELRRVIPVVRGIRARSDIAISIDTYKARIAREALAAGANIVNDISGFRRDPDMAPVAAAAHAGCVVMHMRGTPQTMQRMTDYPDLIGELIEYFRASLDLLGGSGIGEEYIAFDPGIGFSKTVDQNLQLIRDLHRLSVLDRPLLLGPSRKSFIGKTLGIDNPSDRLWGTAAAVACGVMAGAGIVRVHDVAAMRQVTDMASAIARGNSRNPPTVEQA